MNAFKRLAAAAAILAVAALVIIALNSTGGIAFADIVEKAAIPRAVTWNVAADLGEMDLTMRMTLDGQGRMRQEIDQEGGVINIMDFQKKKGITIVHAQKMVIIMDLSSVPNIDESLEELRNDDVMAQLGAMHDADAESLGKQEIDDVDCVGFRATQEGVHYDVWADADTGLPVRIEMAFRFSEVAEHIPDERMAAMMQQMNMDEMNMVFKDFAYDFHINEADFSLEPPEGYTVQDMGDVMEKAAEAFKAMESATE